MRVAYVISNLTYPPREGLHHQTILQIEALIRADTKVILFGFCKDLKELDQDRLEAETGISFYAPPLQLGWPSLAVGLVNQLVPRKLQVILRYRTELEAVLHEAQYDILHLEGAAAIGLLRKHRAHRTILSWIDPGSRRAMRLWRSSRGLRPRLKFAVVFGLNTLFEILVRVKSQHVWWHVVSEPDREYLRRLYRFERAVSIPIIVPDDRVLKRRCAHTVRTAADSSQRLRLLIVADLRQVHMQKSVSVIARMVLPSIDSCDNLDVVLLARVPPPQSITRGLHKYGVTIVEWVEDFSAELKSAHIVVLPDTAGTGIKNRAVQALALGRPTIGTNVAFEGIAVQHLKHAVIVETAESMTIWIKELARNKVLREELARNSPVCVRPHRADAVADAWLDLYKRTIESD